MASPKQLKQVPLGGGINTKLDDKLVRAPQMADLINVEFSTTGAYKKRAGFTALAQTKSISGSISSGSGLATRNNELILFDDDRLYAYDSKNDEWISKGTCVSYEMSEDSVAQKNTNQSSCDVAVLNDVRVVAWFDSADSKIHYEVSDADGGTIYQNDTVLTNGVDEKVRACACSNSIVLIYSDSANNNLYTKEISTTDPTLVNSQTTIKTDLHGNAIWDACEVDNHDQIMLVYLSTAASGSMLAVSLDSDGTITQTGGSDTESTLDTDLAQDIAIDCGTSKCWIVYSVSGTTTTHAWHFTYNSWTGGSFASETEYTNGSISGGTYTVVVDRNTETTAWLVDNGLSGTERGIREIDGSIPLSSDATFKGFLASTGRWSSELNSPVFWSFIESPLQSTYYLLGIDSSFNTRVFARSVVGNASQGLASGSFTQITHLPRFNQYNSSTSKWVWGANDRQRLEIDGFRNSADNDYDELYAELGIRAVTVDSTTTGRYGFVQAGNTSYITGGFLWQYDGYEPHEQGFFHYPEGEDATYGVYGLPGSDSGNMEDGTYFWRCHYDHINRQRERFQSSAVPFTDVITGTDTVTIPFEDIPYTNRTTPISFTCFRTEKDVDLTSGAPFYRVTNPDPATKGDDNGYRETSGTSVKDKYADATIINNELDYMNAELDNIHPETASIITEGNYRVYLAGLALNKNRVYYSKYRQPNKGLEFNDSLVIDVPDDGGKITALGVLNDTLVVFKRDRIYLVAGEGRDNAGRGSFGVPKLISTDTGCKNKLSVVRMPDGLMFESDKGIYLLNQGYQVQYIGAPVEAYNGALTITAATLVNDKNEVRFLTSSGRMLVYDYFVKQWTTWSGVNGVAALIWDNKYTVLQSDGKVLYEDSTATQDDTTSHTMTIVTPWFYLSGPTNYMRIKSAYLLGQFKTDHTMTVGAAYDYDNDSYTDLTFDSTTEYSTDDPYTVKVRPGRQKCMSVQFKLVDTPQSGGGASFELSGIGLELGYKQGSDKLKSGLKI